MIDAFDQLGEWLERIDQQLDARQKRKLTRRIASKLRNKSKQRIRKQVNPDGSRFTPRKRDQIKAIRRGAMFQRLNRHLKTSYSSNRAQVGFAGRTAAIMSAHQEGLVQRPTKDAAPVRYPVRETVGFSDDDITMITNEIREFLLDIG